MFTQSVLSAGRGELAKAVTLPSIRLIVALGVGGVLTGSLFAISQARAAIDQGRLDEVGLPIGDLPLYLLQVAQVVPILLGAWIVGQDVSGSRRSTFLAVPRRGALLTAKLGLAAVLVAATSAACIAAALLPLVSGGEGSRDVHAERYGWLIGYWVVAAVVAASMVAITRNVALGVAPLLAWTLGLSNPLSAAFPVFDRALDQVFTDAYLQGSMPTTADLVGVGLQVAAFVGVGFVAYIRRDCA